MHHVLDNRMGTRSLVDEVSDEVYIIVIGYARMSYKRDEFIITTMYIPDEKRSLLHRTSITVSHETQNQLSYKVLTS